MTQITGGIKMNLLFEPPQRYLIDISVLILFSERASQEAKREALIYMLDLLRSGGDDDRSYLNEELSKKGT